MSLWAGAELDIEPSGQIIDRVMAILANPLSLHRLSAQDVGMLASGMTAMARREGGRWRKESEKLVCHLRNRYYYPTRHLFYNESIGYRRTFSSFASQVYSILALYHFGEAFEVDWAINVAREAAAQVISLQGPGGEWGWFYYVPGGRVVDFYEIYSVHQHGMAPAILHHAVAHGVPGAREALVKGFLWLFGQNEMGISMLRPKEQMFYRSQMREGELGSVNVRVRRSTANAIFRRGDSVRNYRTLALRRECHSYELGWILWSFGGRDDYPELTNRPEFAI